MDDNDDIIASYTFGSGIDQPLLMKRGVSYYYYLADGLGSITAITDESGTVLQEYKYSVFGEIVEQTTDSIPNPFTYTAREWEPEVGLYYYRNRYYNPTIGRFISEDPIGFDAYDVNFYRYVFNNPVLLKDPMGLQFCGPGASGSFSEYIIPDKGFGWDFTECCKQHDCCYWKGTKGDEVGREKCDDDFHECMINSCKNSYTDGTKQQCLKNAETYYNAVKEKGKKHYGTGGSEPGGPGTCGPAPCQQP